MQAQTAEDRFWAKIRKTETCWLWTAGTNRSGYGTFSIGVHCPKILAHRFAYQLLVGPIPAGQEIDHVRARGCTNRNCVNPSHLESISHAENMLRARKTHCVNGHEFTPTNTRQRPNSGRTCRACDAAYRRNRHLQARVNRTLGAISDLTYYLEQKRKRNAAPASPEAA